MGDDKLHIEEVMYVLTSYYMAANWLQAVFEVSD